MREVPHGTGHRRAHGIPTGRPGPATWLFLLFLAIPAAAAEPLKVAGLPVT